jgi:hypothetical protein
MNLEYEITSSTGLANVKISKVTALGDDVSGGKSFKGIQD